MCVYVCMEAGKGRGGGGGRRGGGGEGGGGEGGRMVVRVY